MDQLNKIKLEEDPLSNSYENNKMIITAQFADLARKVLESGIESSAEAVNTIFKVSPAFQNDKIFHDLFPLIFNIELCKYKLKQQKGENRSE